MNDDEQLVGERCPECDSSDIRLGSLGPFGRPVYCNACDQLLSFVFKENDP